MDALIFMINAGDPEPLDLAPRPQLPEDALRCRRALRHHPLQHGGEPSHPCLLHLLALEIKSLLNKHQHLSAFYGPISGATAEVPCLFYINLLSKASALSMEAISERLKLQELAKGCRAPCCAGQLQVKPIP